MYHSTPDATLRCCDPGSSGSRWKGFRKSLQSIAMAIGLLTCALSASAQTLDADTLLLAPPAPSSAVNVCTTSVVVAGFGVDGDLYANTPVVGSDDWFQGLTAGSGVGVVGEG